MGRANLATQTNTVTRGHQGNVVPFDNHRRRLHFEHSSANEAPRGVVVRLRSAARALEHRIDTQSPPSDSNGDRLTPGEFAAAFLLFLSTLTGPALVWALLSF